MENQPPNLKQQAISGAKWVGVSNVIVTFLLFLRITVLGRLLEPSDFGLMSMIMVAINFALVFSDIGISKAIIYKQDISREQLSSLYWINILVSIIMMGIVIGIAPLVASFYNESRLVKLLVYTSVIFPITAIGQQFQVILEKELIFDKLSFAEIISVIIGTASSIIFAFQGYGVFSLIIGQIINTTVRMIIVLVIGLNIYKPKLYLSFNNLKEILRFGLFQMGERSIDYFAGNLDYILIGRFLGAKILGEYFFAYQLVLMPLTKINPILTKVAFPVFSKKQTENHVLNKGYIELSRLIAHIIIPALVGIAVVSPVAVPLLFGGKWSNTIILIQIMVILGIFKALCNPVGTIELAKGRADIGFYWNMTVFVISAIVLYLAVQSGVILLVVSYTVLSITNFVIGLFIIRYLTGLKIMQYLKAIIKPAEYSIVMGIVTFILYILLELSDINSIFMFTVLIISGGVCYFLLIFMFEKSYCKELWGIITTKRGRI